MSRDPLPRTDVVAPDLRSDRAANEFAEKTCTAPAGRSDRMRDIVLAHVPRDRTIRLLDLGAGTGSLLFRLADTFPAGDLNGVDLSAANVRAAVAQKAERPAAAHIRFERVNYLDYTAERFDAIVADGVLHLIPGDTTTLLRKLANDLRPGGMLFCNMPYDCTYNRIFAVVRRGLRIVRSTWLDTLILRVGRLLHGQEMDDDRLRERVEYMYIPPTRMMNRTLKVAAASAGLRVLTEYAMKSTSVAQLRHRVTVFVRDP